MGEAVSCQHCRCAVEDQQPTAQNLRVRTLPFDSSSEEEISDPRERCSSWDATSGTWESTPDELTSEHEDERLVHFTLKPAARFGLQLAEIGSSDSLEPSILVALKVDSISSFAKDVDGKPGIRAGDTIVEVNGRRGMAAEVRDALQQAVITSGSKSITICVQPRPATLHVTLTQDSTSSQKLGVVAVIDKQNLDCLLVQSVRPEGMVPSWNASHPKLRVCSGDLITEVNGISGDSVAMCRAIQTLGENCELRLHVLTSSGGDICRSMKLQHVQNSLEGSRILSREAVGPKSSAGGESGRMGAPTATAGSCDHKPASSEHAEDNSSDASTDFRSVGTASSTLSVIDCQSG